MEYPSFYESHIRSVIERYRTDRAMAERGFGFVFLTDVHIHLNGRASVPLILEVGKCTDIKTVLCGGDHCWAFGSKAQCLADFADSLGYMDPLKDAMQLFHARGNHDVTVRSSWELDTGYTMPYSQVQAAFASHMSTPSGAVPGKLYYYHDEPEAKIRFVVLDTNEIQLSEEHAWGVLPEMEAQQLKWFANCALSLPGADWSVIVMGHIPCSPELSASCDALQDLRLILEAYREKKACAYRDFSDAVGELVAYFGGHNHKDRATIQNAVLHISTGCDAYCKDDDLTRNVGEIENTLFDVCLVDSAKRKLVLYRVGAGKSRSFSY